MGKNVGSLKNPERLQEWTFRRNAPEIYCKMSKGKLKFEIEPDTEDLVYYSEAKDITDRLNNNSAEITKLYKQLKTEMKPDVFQNFPVNIQQAEQ